MSTETKRQRTNATARLNVILQALYGQTSQGSVADVLVSVFNLKDEKDPSRAFLLAYTAITRMLESSQNEVEKYLRDESAQYLRAFQSLRNYFNPKNAAQQWNAYRANLAIKDLTAIEFTALHLQGVVPEFEATESDLAAIEKAIDDLDQELLSAAGISTRTREALRTCIGEIRRAVRDYKIWGADGIDNAFKAFTGTLVVDPYIQKDIKDDSEKGGRLWDVISKLGGRIILITGILHGAYQVRQDYLPLLQNLLGQPPAITEPHQAKPTIDGEPNGGKSRPRPESHAKSIDPISRT